MSKTANTTRTAAIIADDALEYVRCGKEQVRWMGSLMTAIILDLEHNKGRRVADLASLGQHLADDCANNLDIDAERLQRELDVAREVAQ